ncbi:malate dehydrogenase [Richelia sinica FACHB-800]|uniref:Malate dehydrogenase n=1 Tax=Richelia sinica FACHB-800 TaxID=1357546 RepID=A0A975Y588_9NOST|nr:malate dehydrogenase [Richelia sinica FACHB-800]
MGCSGIEKIIEISISEAEKAALLTSAESVRRNINQAQKILDSL